MNIVDRRGGPGSILVVVSTLLPLVGFTAAMIDLHAYAIPDRIVDTVHPNSERSLHTWWSIVQLTAASVLAFHAGFHVHARWNRCGRGLIFLSVLLLALSLDETMQLHEAFSNFMDDQSVDLWNLPRWSLWVAVGAPLFTLAAVATGWLLTDLQGRVRKLLIVGAALFLMSAAGLELVSGLLVRFDLPAWVLEVELLFEEAGEAVAVSLVVVAMLQLRREISENAMVPASIAPDPENVGPRHAQPDP